MHVLGFDVRIFLSGLVNPYNNNGGHPLFLLSPDVSLPALFMPTVSSKNLVYTPRAHGYFHPPGSTDIRITQPPTVFKLPALHRTVSFVSFACSSYRMLVNVGRSLETIKAILALSFEQEHVILTSSCTLGLVQYCE